VIGVHLDRVLKCPLGFRFSVRRPVIVAQRGVRDGGRRFEHHGLFECGFGLLETSAFGLEHAEVHVQLAR
jgi:hypothetical protein